MRRILAMALFLSCAASQAQAQIRIGASGPVTGSMAIYGENLKNGVTQAIEDINASGGVLGQKLELVFGDDQGDPRQGVSVANKMVGDGVRFLVGHINSGVTIPATNVYSEAGVLAITPTGTNPQITERGLPMVFRACGRDDQQGAVAGKYLAEKFKGKTIAIVHDKTTYGKGLADETQKALRAAGGQDAVYLALNAGEKDYTAVVSRLKAANVDVVFYGGAIGEAGLLLRQMRDQGVQATLMSGDGISSTEFATLAGPAVAGTLMTYSRDPRHNPAAKDAVARFMSKNIDPEPYVLYSYASVQVLAEAMKRAKSTDPKAVAAEMHRGDNFETVVGPIAFDAKGDVKEANYFVFRWGVDGGGKAVFDEVK